MVGGQLVVESAPHQGTTVQAQIPLGKVARGGKKAPMNRAQPDLEAL
jgi:hypothetical protein